MSLTSMRTTNALAQPGRRSKENRKTCPMPSGNMRRVIRKDTAGGLRLPLRLRGHSCEEAELFGGANGWPSMVLPVREPRRGQPSLTCSLGLTYAYEQAEP